MSKTLLYHDTFLMRGWAERLNIEIAKTLNTDIATALWSTDCYDAGSMWFTWEINEVNPDFKRGIFWFLIMKWQFFRSKGLLANYDTVIFSNEAITWVWWIKPGTKTYYYAHSISRHLFDQREQYLLKTPFILRPIFLIFSVFLRWLYKKEISKIDTIFVNSVANKQRMSEWLNRDDAIILYPSVDTNKFNIFDEKSISQIIAIEWISNIYKDYYISFSRLTHAKRINSIIEAFKQLPDKKIVILYGENDSQREEFIKMWSWYPNILFHKLTDNNNLPYIINWALASISISENEDFGMVAIESMACGVPVIAVDEWW
jgi:glycosyltransferase involved in cell wall biosynthesis